MISKLCSTVIAAFLLASAYSCRHFETKLGGDRWYNELMLLNDYQFGADGGNYLVGRVWLLVNVTTGKLISNAMETIPLGYVGTMTPVGTLYYELGNPLESTSNEEATITEREVAEAYLVQEAPFSRLLAHILVKLGVLKIYKSRKTSKTTQITATEPSATCQARNKNSGNDEKHVLNGPIDSTAQVEKGDIGQTGST